MVLLILAGVSIAMLTGDNGILTQAQKAKNATENAQVLEENRLDEYKNYYASYSEKLTETKKIIEKFNSDLSDLSTGTTPKQVWTEYFKRYKNIQCLTRELVVTLIEDITVYKDRTIKIHFKYQDEYNTLKKYAEDLEVV